MSGRFALWLALLSAAILPAPAASGQSPSRPLETRHLSLTTSSTPASARRGAEVVLALDVVLKPKMHVYAPDQPKEQDYMPIALTLTPDAAAYRPLKVRYPAAEKFFFEPLNETQRVYSKPFRIAQPVILAGNVTGDVTISGTVKYQACDDAICYVPQNVPVTWTVRLAR
jgi:hypothetical protein